MGILFVYASILENGRVSEEYYTGIEYVSLRAANETSIILHYIIADKTAYLNPS